jgi:hypothetical protein
MSFHEKDPGRTRTKEEVRAVSSSVVSVAGYAGHIVSFLIDSGYVLSMPSGRP